MMAKRRGRFVTVEGQDGAGKTTHIAVIRNILRQSGIPFLETREPGGTPLGEILRDLVLNRRDLSIVPLAELLAIFAARAQHIQELIEPALAAGTWVLCDRFTDASYAYQGGGRGVPYDSIETLENLVQGALRPDLTVLLDVDVDVGRSRIAQRGDADRFEAEADAFKAGVRRQYLLRAQRDPGRVKTINANRPMAAVQNDVAAVIHDFLEAVGDD